MRLIAPLCLLMVFSVAGEVASEDGADALLAAGDRVYAARSGAGDVLHAVDLYREALEREPDSYEVHWRLARMYWWLSSQSTEPGDWVTLAKAHSQRAVDIDPGGVDGLFWHASSLGQAAVDGGILRGLASARPVRDALERVLAVAPEHAPAHFLLGVVYRVLPGWPISIGNRRKAVEHAAAAVRYAPANTFYWLGLAEAQRAARQHAEAAATLRALIARPVAPEEPFERQGDRDRARQLLAQWGYEEQYPAP